MTRTPDFTDKLGLDQVRAHDRHVQEAAQAIRRHLVAERVKKHDELARRLEALDAVCGGLRGHLVKYQAERVRLEGQLLESRRPAECLNRDLFAYLGHGELKFDVAETGYRIVRGDTEARGLSEGEKTAIALLYFLRSLEDRRFTLSGGVVVLDDPVSSLDSNALFCAFGFMRERLHQAGQLFVLTHNFPFFRQVRAWFQQDFKSTSNFYMLRPTASNHGRASTLAPLDPLLLKYDSEYHFLFSLVSRAAAATSPELDLQQYYYLPNVARRLLEAFLEFKLPDTSAAIRRKLDQVSYDPARKNRIVRFCDTHSHYPVIEGVENDPVQLAEGREVAKDILSLIQAMDKGHSDRMQRLVDQASAAS